MVKLDFPVAGRVTGCCCWGVRFRLGGVRAKHEMMVKSLSNYASMTMQKYLLTSYFYLCLQITFPPSIYYKIFTHRPITDVCASSPRDYPQLGLKKPVTWQTNNGWPLIQEDQSGWYQHMENNSWTLLCRKVRNMLEIILYSAFQLQQT